MKTNNTAKNKTVEQNNTETKQDFVFTKFNYIAMIVGLVVLGIGYIMLSGGGSDDPNVFNPAMFDTRRLYTAPILIVLGFIIEIAAIMIDGNRFTRKNNDTDNANAE